MQIQNFTVESAYDALPLSCTIYEPQGAPKGIFQIVHGMCEYKERYDGFLRFLAEYGPYTACAGVVMVSEKYPFYRAYQTSEQLCDNAKKYAAQLVAEHPDWFDLIALPGPRELFSLTMLSREETMHALF